MIQFNHISKSYEGHKALQDVSFAVQQGTVLGLLGPNGAGKTTLIRILARIINADTGQILINGKSHLQTSRGQVGYLPEERGLYKKMKVLEHLKYIATLRELDKPTIQRECQRWLEKLDLWEWRNHLIEDLSKGMQQKIQFINAVLHRPDILILDEPFSGFDPINAEQIKSEIIKLKKEGCTILLSTHRMESVEELCDDIALINKSKCILSGNLNEIKKTNSPGTYSIVTASYIDFETADYQVIASYQNQDSSHYTVEIKNTTYDSNDLITYIMASTKLIAFEKTSLTIEQIFLKLVQ